MICVVSMFPYETRLWLRNKVKITREDHNAGMMWDEEGNEYKLVTNKSHIQGCEFTAVLVAPDYEDLVIAAKQRIR